MKQSIFLEAVQLLQTAMTVNLFISFMARSLSYRNQSIDLFCKSIDWFQYDRDLCHEKVTANVPVQK